VTVGERFIARPSPSRILFLLVLAFGLVALGAWLAGLIGPSPDPGVEWIGWITLLFFGLCAAAGVRRLFDPDVQIVVDASGLYWKQLGTRTIPWSEIDRIEAQEFGRDRFLCVFLKNPEKFRATGWTGALRAANRGFGFGDFGLSTAGTDRSEAELIEAIKRHAPEDVEGL